MLMLAAEGGGEAPAPPGGQPFNTMLFLLMAGFFVIYFLMIRPQQREQSRRTSMLAGVKKNDRVLTTSGIYGVVMNVHREIDEVTVKVDEATNTKLRMSLNSIAQVLGGEEAAGEDSSAK
jgi:preprotein translocase subunit YajC